MKAGIAKRVAVAGLCMAALAWGGRIMAQEILSCENGYLTFSNSNPSLYYTVEFLPCEGGAGEWNGSYRGLQDIRSEAGVVTASVGMVYRVVGSDTARYTRTLSPSSVSVAEGYYTATNLSQVDTDMIAGNIRGGASIFGIAGDPNVANTASGDAAPEDILLGKKAWVDGSEVAGVIETRMLSSTTVVVQAGFYGATNLVEVDAEFTAANIRHGVSVFGIEGSCSGYAIPKTGQTNSYYEEDDGWWEKGGPSPEPRFTVQANTNLVADNLTGLMWIRSLWGVDANTNTWETTNAIQYCNALVNYEGYSDWRLPNVRELMSLVDYGHFNPALPPDHPFHVDIGTWCLTGTAIPTTPEQYYTVYMESGEIRNGGTAYVWPVRGGQ